MKSTRLLWRTAGAIGLLSTLLFLFGFVYAVQTTLNPKPTELGQAPAPTPQPQQNALDSSKIQILALGDSLTKGTGDTSGKGYVERVKEGLAKDLKKEVFVWNYAVIGSTTQQLLDSLNKPGSQLPDFIKQSNVILLTIGGNDIFRTGVNGNNILNSKGELNIDMDSLANNLPEATARLDKIFTRIAELNPKAKIVYTMFYHPFLDVDPDRKGSKAVQDFADAASRSANKYSNITVVPTYDLFQQNLLKYLYNDHYHPNQEGYARMAERVRQVLE
ncbi:GSCFA domain-containing protein [Paenibacillus sp. CC-CFT747]|nr:GSCFA domain-containing protein [Paenibacillus sp. CC-CFT747]